MSYIISYDINTRLPERTFSTLKRLKNYLGKYETYSSGQVRQSNLEKRGPYSDRMCENCEYIMHSKTIDKFVFLSTRIPLRIRFGTDHDRM